MRTALLGALLSLLAVAASPQAAPRPPSLLRARVSVPPWNVQSGGIAACEVALDDKGAVQGADIVQDVAPYGAQLRDDIVSSWSFEPARESGRGVPAHVLVLGFFRPPSLHVPAPDVPLYKKTKAPETVPWPTHVEAPPIPPNVTGSAQVILEADVSEQGRAGSPRVLSQASAFDQSALDTLRAWTFRPASRGGRPVASRVFLVFSYIGVTP
ncbi:MAG TPA: energy transducer TonB [Vicinamibacteria bacterium]|nr:energy transducer TonB [Vicinamibacteria bacterium]